TTECHRHTGSSGRQECSRSLDPIRPNERLRTRKRWRIRTGCLFQHDGSQSRPGSQNERARKSIGTNNPPAQPASRVAATEFRDLLTQNNPKYPASLRTWETSPNAAPRRFATGIDPVHRCDRGTHTTKPRTSSAVSG